MMANYNDYMRWVVLRISEVRDLGEVNRYAFYDHMKRRGDATRCDAGQRQVHSAALRGERLRRDLHHQLQDNGIYLPADDRRTTSHGPISSWPILKRLLAAFWNWYMNEDGFSHVAAFLAERDLSSFDAKAPPNKTIAFWAIIDANTPVGRRIRRCHRQDQAPPSEPPTPSR